MPEPSPQQQRFNVHLYPVVRLVVSGVEAASHQDAVEKAIEQTDLCTRFASADGEYAEEISHFLVDVVGDDDYAQSWWFYSRQSPLMANFKRLIAWYDNGGSDDELDSIIADARAILAASI